ncbi:MAG TPA: alpha/beta hydrolase [Terracidiphilus sp.]|nr:alpha/beta hydrolase [Terracidiphilus sp.]
MKIRRILLPLLGLIVALSVGGGIAFWLRPVECAWDLLYLRMALMGIRSRSTVVAGIPIHYDVSGPAGGPAIVLVHGLGGRSEDWVNLAPYLSRAGYRVYMPDLPGYGRSARPASFSYSVPDEANVVVAFMDTMGLKQVDLGGWSMGGWIVEWIASRHSERVKRLLLFDAAGIYVQPAWNTDLFTPQNAAQIDQLDALLMPHPPRVPGFVAADILRISREHAWVIHRALDSMLTGRDATDRILPDLKMPVLIVWGAEDHITPIDQANTIHRLVPQSQLDVIPGCGHLAPSQCASQIGPTVVEFLGR